MRVFSNLHEPPPLTGVHHPGFAAAPPRALAPAAPPQPSASENGEGTQKRADRAQRIITGSWRQE
jgi:hypothetical protein